MTGISGELLKLYRRARGLTQLELARRAGIDPSTLSRYERDEIPSPDVTAIKRLCNELDIPARLTETSDNQLRLKLHRTDPTWVCNVVLQATARLPHARVRRSLEIMLIELGIPAEEITSYLRDDESSSQQSHSQPTTFVLRLPHGGVDLATSYDIEPFNGTKDDIEMLAEQVVAERFNCLIEKVSYPIHVLWCIEYSQMARNLGLEIRHDSMMKHNRGELAYTWWPDGRPEMVLHDSLFSKKNFVFRARSVSAHEFGHALLHRPASKAMTDKERRAAMHLVENQANHFARALLMPRVPLRIAVSEALRVVAENASALPRAELITQLLKHRLECSPYEGRTISQYFGVSHELIRVRLNDKGILPQEVSL